MVFCSTFSSGACNALSQKTNQALHTTKQRVLVMWTDWIANQRRNMNSLSSVTDTRPLKGYHHNRGLLIRVLFDDTSHVMTFSTRGYIDIRAVTIFFSVFMSIIQR